MAWIWVNLNGAWEFRFDGERVGKDERWFEPNEEAWPDQILVPFCWESLAAWGEADAAGNDNYFATRVYRNPLEVTRENYRGSTRFEVGWYRREIFIPQNEHWENKRVILTIGAADFFTELWCNGRYLGEHEGGYTPFEFDLTDALMRAPNDQLGGPIVLRVADPMDNSEQPVGKQWAWYSSVSGIWQTVFLEPRAPNYIERFEITTELRNSEACFRVFTNGDGELALHVTAPDGEQFSATTKIEQSAAECRLSLGEAILWDTTAPNLYQVQFTFRGGAVADVVRSYFGMRTLAAAAVADAKKLPAALALNGEPIYIRGALYQSYYPDGVYTAGDAQALRDDIEYAKRVGFDLLRVHIKIDDPLLFYYADSLGMLFDVRPAEFRRRRRHANRSAPLRRKSARRDRAGFQSSLDRRVVPVQRDPGFWRPERIRASHQSAAARERRLGSPNEKRTEAEQRARLRLDSGNVAARQKTRLDAAGRRHERRRVGTRAVLRARAHRREFLAFLYQRLRESARRDRRCRGEDLHRLELQLYSRFSSGFAAAHLQRIRRHRRARRRSRHELVV